jgi:hypothetical protein
VKGRVLVLVVALFVLGAARADAATYCVDVEAAGCTDEPSAGAAFSAARQDAALDVIVLGRLTESGTFTDAPGRPVRVVGAGAGGTVLRTLAGTPALRLQDGDSSASELRLEGTGGASALQVDTGGSVRSAEVAGPVSVRGGDVQLDSVAISGGPVQVSCAASSTDLTLDQVSVGGTGAAGVSASCTLQQRTIVVRAANTAVWGFQRGFALGPASRLIADYADFPEAAGGTNLAVDPGFAGPGDLRLRPGSPLIDAGQPGSLANSDSQEDALGFVRAADGNGDGVPRRDIGALELQPPPPAPLAGNVLTNPGAEAGTPATDDRASPAPPGWTRRGGFTSVRYGTVAGQFPFPTRRVGDALNAGDAFFAAGPGKDGRATQSADLSGAAPEIDRGRGRAALSALLGGYRSSADGAIVDAIFRGPSGARLGSLTIGPVTPDQRAGASNLLPRTAARAIPRLTRRIDVTLRSTPAAGGYDDAYFDAVSLVPTVRGRPARQGREPGRRIKPYGGLTMLTARVAVDSHRRAWVRMACPSRTVGRCRGVITLASRLGGRGELRIARRRVALRAGRIVRRPMRLRVAARRRLRRRAHLEGHLYAATRDRQGVTRTATTPVRIVRGRRF